MIALFSPFFIHCMFYCCYFMGNLFLFCTCFPALHFICSTTGAPYARVIQFFIYTLHLTLPRSQHPYCSAYFFSSFFWVRLKFSNCVNGFEFMKDNLRADWAVIYRGGNWKLIISHHYMKETTKMIWFVADANLLLLPNRLRPIGEAIRCQSVDDSMKTNWF